MKHLPLVLCLLVLIGSRPVTTPLLSPLCEPYSGFHSAQESVRPGDTLGAILSRHLSPGDEENVLTRLRTLMELRSIKPGWVLTFLSNDGGFVGRLTLTSTDGWSVILSRQCESWDTRITPGIFHYHPATIDTEITSSLVETFDSLHLPMNLVVSFVSIFQWEVDFFRDIRKGDRVQLVYLKDDKGRAGPILFARMTNGGRTMEAVNYAGHFYAADGSSLKRAFLRAPLKAATITSTFSMSRYHPILHRRMPHFGVDYAASTGTPIVATGDGRVFFKGYRRGWGNTVTLQHANGIRTSYLHMSRFKRNLHRGSRVKAGEVIGYVGQTGLATGPHVDYRITVHGKYTNPLHFVSPPAPPLPDSQKAEFLTVARHWQG